MPYSLNKKVDRRQNPRKSIAVKVYLSWPGQRPCRCWVADLSMSGALIKAGSLRIPENEIVKLIFVLPGDPLIKIYRQSATVVHRSDKGLGLMFK